MTMTYRFLFFILIVLLPSTVLAGMGISLRTGVDHFNWSVRHSPVKRPQVSIESDPYQLASLSVDVTLQDAPLGRIDYYQPVNAEKKGSFYVNDLKSVSVRPLAFLIDESQSYSLRVPLTVEYIKDTRIFSTSVKTLNGTPYRRLDGTDLAMDGPAATATSRSSFERSELSFDVLGGLFSLANWLEPGEVANSPALFKPIEFRLGLIESDCLHPMEMEKSTMEALLRSRGFTYGFMIGSRTEAGLNGGVHFSYGQGNMRFNDRTVRVKHEYNFGEIWLNIYSTINGAKVLFTLGYTAEWVEIIQGEATILRRDTLRSTYLKTGICF
jgi:hypothetical protein